MRPNWIEDEIPAKFKQISFFFNENRFISSLEQMTDPVMPSIESLGINTSQLAHSS